MDILRMSEEDIADLEKQIKLEGTEPDEADDPVGQPTGTVKSDNVDMDEPEEKPEPKPKPEPKDDDEDA